MKYCMHPSVCNRTGSKGLLRLSTGLCAAVLSRFNLTIAVKPPTPSLRYNSSDESSRRRTSKRSLNLTLDGRLLALCLQALNTPRRVQVIVEYVLWGPEYPLSSHYVGTWTLWVTIVYIWGTNYLLSSS